LTVSPVQIDSIKVLGVTVHMVEIPGLVDCMSYWIENEQDRCHQIVNTGMHGIMIARRESEFKDLLNSADMFFPDGISVLWVARGRGFKLRKRLTGPELMPEFFKVANERGYSSFFYGDTQETLDELSVKMKERFPGATISGAYSPPFRDLTPEEDEEIIDMINAAKPDVLWVGLGCPKQDRWISEHRDRLNVPVAIGVGAYFKFHSGRVSRAPSWIGNLGFEWLWRLIKEPRLVWRRVFIDSPIFLTASALELIGIKRYQ